MFPRSSTIKSFIVYHLLPKDIEKYYDFFPLQWFLSIFLAIVNLKTETQHTVNHLIITFQSCLLYFGCLAVREPEHKVLNLKMFSFLLKSQYFEHFYTNQKKKTKKKRKKKKKTFIDHFLYKHIKSDGFQDQYIWLKLW